MYFNGSPGKVLIKSLIKSHPFVVFRQHQRDRGVAFVAPIASRVAGQVEEDPWVTNVTPSLFYGISEFASEFVDVSFFNNPLELVNKSSYQRMLKSTMLCNIARIWVGPSFCMANQSMSKLPNSFATLVIMTWWTLLQRRRWHVPSLPKFLDDGHGGIKVTLGNYGENTTIFHAEQLLGLHKEQQTPQRTATKITASLCTCDNAVS